MRDLRDRQVERGEALHSFGREIDPALPVGHTAGNDDLRRLAAAEVEDQFRCQFQTRHHEFGIDAALEAVARIGLDTQLATRRCDRDRIEEGRFHEDVGRRLRAARLLAAHDAGDAARAPFVGDHAHGRIEGVGLAVEGEDLFAVLGHARLHVALELVGVEDVERTAAVIGDQIGDVDQRRNRSEADRAQAVLQPFG